MQKSALKGAKNNDYNGNICCEIGLDEKKISSGENGSVYQQVRVAVVSSIGTFICGVITGWSGASLTKLDKDFKMSAFEHSVIASMIGYGGLVGSLFAGKVQDLIGRRSTMLAVSPLLLCGWTMLGLATNLYLIYVARFLLSLSTGFLLNTCSIYISETSQPSLRGRLSSLTSLNLSIGVLASYILGGALPWRIACFIFLIPPMLFTINVYLLPESPYWYLLKKNTQRAEESLKYLRGDNFDTEKEICSINDKIAEVGRDVSYLELFSRRTRKPFLVALFIQTIQQMSGGTEVIVYTSKILLKAGININPELSTICSGVFQVFGTILCTVLIDKCGRKKLLTVSVGLSGIFCMALGLFFFFLDRNIIWPQWTAVIFVSGIGFSFSLGTRSIAWLIGGEIFNTSIRSRANSAIVMYNRALSIVIVQVYPFTAQAIGNAWIFLIYSILSAFFILGNLMFVLETNGKSLEEIQEHFDNKTFPNFRANLKITKITDGKKEIVKS